MARIKLHGDGPRPVKGYIDYLYKDGNRNIDTNIDD